MRKLLEHKGVVSEVGEEVVEVEFVTETACSGCKAKGLCGVEEGDKRFVTVWEPNAQYFAVGEEVMIGVSEVMGMKAAVYAYIIPFFILVGGLFATSLLHWSELTRGLSSLGVMCLYYVGLWLMRSRIEKEIVFKIRKLI
ncbi:MAG: SoxR reducing system RseC family protein [Alistipes sp.]|nr:SoxR reducing system RseC family protein [Alistipes sp.]